MSAMARPRPVPATSSLARWKRSNTASRWSSGIPGPESSTRRSTREPQSRTLTSTRPLFAREFAGVVDENPRQAVDQVRLRLHRERAVADPLHGEVDPVRRGQGPEALHTALDHVADVRQVGIAGPALLTVRPGQPEQVFDDPAQAGALPAHPFEHFPIGGRIARPVERQTHLGLDDRDGGPKFVRCIGGEVGLPATDELRRCGRPQTDHRRASEHGDGQDRAEHELGDQERRLDVRSRGRALAGHQQGVVRSQRVEPEG